MEKSIPVAMHIEKQTMYERHPDGPEANQLQYKEAIGTLQYAAPISRLDISIATGKHARYTENYSLIHGVGVKQIFQYLYGTVKMPLCLHNGGGTSQTGLVSDTDADYSGDNGESKSTSGTLMKYRDCTVYWRSEKQTSTATSTIESEINSMALSIVEAEWLQNIVGDPLG